MVWVRELRFVCYGVWRLLSIGIVVCGSCGVGVLWCVGIALCWSQCVWIGRASCRERG